MCCTVDQCCKDGRVTCARTAHGNDCSSFQHSKCSPLTVVSDPTTSDKKEKQENRSQVAGSPMQLLGSHIRLGHQSVVAPRLRARCSAQQPDSAHDLPVDEGGTPKVTRQPAQRPWARMNRRILLVQTALSMAACPCCVAPASADSDGEWDYATHGPSSWPGACKVRMLCSASSESCLASKLHSQASGRSGQALRSQDAHGQELDGHPQSRAKPTVICCCRQERRRAPSTSR